MNKKTRKQTLRQRLRVDATKELNDLALAAKRALGKIANPAGIGVTDLAKMLGSSQKDSLEKALITALADKKEAELVKIYDTQKAGKSDQ